MKLMRKITLIFIIVTVISSALYYVLGEKIIYMVNLGELAILTDRTNGAIEKIEDEINKVTSQVMEFGEYLQIVDRIDKKYGIGEIEEIINIKNKIEVAPIKNMIMLNDDFQIDDVLKINGLNINSTDFQEVLNKSREIMNKKENEERGFLSGTITTEESVYIVGIKRIENEKYENSKYVAIIQPMNEEFIEEMNKITERSLQIIKYSENIFNKESMRMIDLYGRDFYSVVNDDSIDIFSKFDILGDGPEYYIGLKDERAVMKNITINITLLIVLIIILTIIGNLLLYRFIRKRILDRIININTVVNKVTSGMDLEIELEDDINGDEISILTGDLNKMFSSLKNYSDNLEYIGSHDLLTSLINRNKLNEYIGELKNNNEEFALFFIDLDNFKIINDTLGHNVGDQLLCQVAKELTECTCGENIIISRIGGDEFVVVRKGKNDNFEIEKLAKNMLVKLNKTYGTSNYAYQVKASMGISFYPQHSDDEVNLLQYSDVAMYNSKASGGNSFTIFNKNMLETLEIENKLKSGIKNEEFKVYYQPIYGVSAERIIGAEALVRWETEEGIIYPDKFIQLAKKTGDIVEIDMLVLRQAINLCREWIDKGKEDFYVSINASKRFLKQNNVIEIIESELKYKNVPSSALRLEITEDEIIDDIEYTKELLKKIRKIGIKVYLDDFGTGYSSFNHIKTLPVDVVKIDRSLLIDIERDAKAKSIVETMINLCHNLGLKVVCEGVEDSIQVEILKKLNCDDIQGYYFSKPIGKEKFDKYLEEF